MGALPKNKITRAERGKRRLGNTPSLKKQANHTTVPLHKRGFVDQMLQTLGLKASSTSAKKAAKEARKEATKQANTPKLDRESKSTVKRSVNKPSVRRISKNKDA